MTLSFSLLLKSHDGKFEFFSQKGKFIFLVNLRKWKLFLMQAGLSLL